MKKSISGSTSLNLTKFSSGAVRSSDANKYAFHAGCPLANLRGSETWREGLEKYSLDNWSKGMSILDTYNHIQRHMNLYLLGDDSEDHLAHARWGLDAIMHFEGKCRCHIKRAALIQKDKDYLNAQLQPSRNRKRNVARTQGSRS